VGAGEAVRLTVRFLGLDLLDIEVTTDVADEDTDRDASGGTLSSTPMGFVPSWGDQRWEKAADLGE